MVTLDGLRKNLAVTQEDMTAVIDNETRRLMEQTGNVILHISSKYAFRYSCCAGMKLSYAVYSLTKEVIGPGYFARKTDIDSIKSTKGIMLLGQLGYVPEFSSTLNITEDGPTCDHCRDSVYNEDGVMED